MPLASLVLCSCFVKKSPERAFLDLLLDAGDSISAQAMNTAVSCNEVEKQQVAAEVLNKIRENIEKMSEK